MNIFVTGATGFLGKSLCKRLKELGHSVVEVSSKSCDLTQIHSLGAWNGVQFDQIYHLAAWTQAGDFCLKHPGEQWLINQKINTHVLDWWVQKQPQAKLIAMGTSCSYPAESSLREEEYLTGLPIDSLFTYAMTKRMLLTGLMAMQKQWGLEYLYLIPSTLYGADYHEDGRQMHFIFDLVRKILRGVLYDEPVVLWGNGEQKRELIHVADFLSAALPLVEKEKNTWINIGSGEEHSIREFAAAICRIVGYPFEKIQYDLSRYVGAKSKVLNVQKLKRILPHFSIRPLQSGLEEVVQWFREKELLLRP
jgi:GDP-L-fucose synthase